MSVVVFERKQGPEAWSEAELQTLFAALSAPLAPADGRRWEPRVTERGDPQLYLLGPLPDQACELCVSRIGRRYILEDGSGRLLFQHESPALLAVHAEAAVRATRWPLVARALLLWCTVRQMIHNNVEPLLADSEELLIELAPQ